VDAVFQALCEGALANPDLDAEEDEGDFFFDEVRLRSTGCPALTPNHLPTWGASDSQLSYPAQLASSVPQQLARRLAATDIAQDPAFYRARRPCEGRPCCTDMLRQPVGARVMVALVNFWWKSVNMLLFRTRLWRALRQETTGQLSWQTAWIRSCRSPMSFRCACCLLDRVSYLDDTMSMMCLWSHLLRLLRMSLNTSCSERGDESTIQYKPVLLPKIRDDTLDTLLSAPLHLAIDCCCPHYCTCSV